MYQRMLGEIVRHLREQNGWSQGQLANKAGTSKQSIHQIETAETNTPIDRVAKILELLGARLFIAARPPDDPAHPVWVSGRKLELLRQVETMDDAELEILLRISRALPHVDDEGRLIAARSLEREANRAK